MAEALVDHDPGDESLEELGFQYAEALELTMAGVSWHDAQGLIMNGATPSQAVSILLP